MENAVKVNMHIVISAFLSNLYGLSFPLPKLPGNIAQRVTCQRYRTYVRKLAYYRLSNLLEFLSVNFPTTLNYHGDLLFKRSVLLGCVFKHAPHYQKAT